MRHFFDNTSGYEESHYFVLRHVQGTNVGIYVRKCTEREADGNGNDEDVKGNLERNLISLRRGCAVFYVGKEVSTYNIYSAET